MPGSGGNDTAVGSPPHRYLDGLPADQQVLLGGVNSDGLKALRGYLTRGEAVAFLGAGASAPLYPLWAAVISELVDIAATVLTDDAAATCRAEAASRPDAVVDLVRHTLGAADYRKALREIFRVRRDPDTGRSWTATHELVARCAFRAVVTTNYDPGILDARMRVRPRASGTGFATWADEDAMDRWRTGDVFGDDELPVLFAHGHHNRPEHVVLATTDYRRAYAGKLARVLGRLLDSGHLVWIGFSFTDQRIGAIIREVAEGSGTRSGRGGAARHVAVMPWDPAAAGDGAAPNDPKVLQALARTDFGCQLVLYPTSGDDHSALQTLLGELTDPRFPPVPDTPSTAPWRGVAVEAGGHGDRRAHGTTSPGSPASPVGATRPTGPALWPRPASDGGPVVRWVHGGIPVARFIGRAAELDRLDRWDAEAQVRLVGVTAWGGAGKTALVTEWLTRHGRSDWPGTERPVQGVFAWSFYEDRSAERWAHALLSWVEREFDLEPGSGPLAARVLAVAWEVPLLLVLDGLEVLQEGPAGTQFGRLLDGTLREVLTGWCHLDHTGLAVLTSRFPFADLEGYDGAAARMLDVPPFTPGEGAVLLGTSGAGWLTEADRRELSSAVDGHALALAVLAAALIDQPPSTDIHTLRDTLVRAGRTHARVAKVLDYYASRITYADRQLIAIVSMFQHPVPAATLLALGTSSDLDAPLTGWTSTAVETAARQRLAGLLTWHPDRTVSAHPLVRDTFRAFVLRGDTARLASDATLADLPAGAVASRDDALRVVDMIELLLDAGQWEDADNLYQARADDGRVWQTLPAARLGQRAATAFVATAARRHTCSNRLSEASLAYYLNEAGLHGMAAGDLAAASGYLGLAADAYRTQGDSQYLPVALRNLGDCHLRLGNADQAQATITEAIALARPAGDRGELRNCYARMGAALDLAGDTAAADSEFATADLIEVTDNPEGKHLYSLRGIQWGEFLARTGRTRAARRLATLNWQVSYPQDWSADVARCNWLLGRLDRDSDHPQAAGNRLDAAVRTFQNGDFLVEWAQALPDLADHVRRTGEFDHAEQLCAQAIVAAGPRGLVPTHALALAIRATIRADRFFADGDTGHLARARDDADHSLRLATRAHRLPWAELDALVAHAYIDESEGVDRGWQLRADELRTTLVPPGLDPDPLATVERRAARKKKWQKLLNDWWSPQIS